METPPQFPGAPKKSKTGLIIGGIALAVILCCCGGCGALLYFGKNLVGDALNMVGCAQAIESQREGLLAYAEKHGGKLPPAANWQNSIKPYVTNVEDEGMKELGIKLPTVDDQFCDPKASTSITYNTAIAGKPLKSIKDQANTPALFETPGQGRNKSAAYKPLPFESSPVFVKDQRRGWLVIPLDGKGYVLGQNGQKAPIKARSSRSFEFGN